MKGDHEMSKKKNEAFETSEEILETTPEEEIVPAGLLLVHARGGFGSPKESRTPLPSMKSSCPSR